jgi:hypothetical protein
VNKINLITPPDRLYNNDYSFLLIYPSTAIKEQFNNLISEIDRAFNVYLYEVEDDAHDPDWLLGLAKQADCVILDIDNCPSNITVLSSYFIANSNTYWLTNGEQLFYNKISPNRIYNLDSIVHGGTLEKE